jgi:hypothetical protein
MVAERREEWKERRTVDRKEGRKKERRDDGIQYKKNVEGRNMKEGRKVDEGRKMKEGR